MELINIKHCIRIPIFNIQKTPISTFIFSCFLLYLNVVIYEEHIYPCHTTHFGIVDSAVFFYCYVLYFIHSNTFHYLKFLFPLLSLAPVITFAIPRRVLWLVYILLLYDSPSFQPSALSPKFKSHADHSFIRSSIRISVMSSCNLSCSRLDTSFIIHFEFHNIND